jgi:hypothetical protein
MRVNWMNVDEKAKEAAQNFSRRQLPERSGDD